ncbi:SPOR domain-containing protein [Aeromonas sp.]|uniref:SPOR domain-containing protein n=1 Tax=Aeromonas sp. TaxID=647 RepID=UPI003F38801C
MATRDYVGNSPRRRAGGRNTKKAAPRRFPVIPALLAGALVVGFGAFLYLINGKGADAPTIEEQVKANKPKAQGNGLPQEKWSYIERLENKQVDVIEPPPQPGVLPPPPAETLTLQPEKLPKPVETAIPQPGTPIGQVKPYQPQPVQPTKPATGAPVASAQEQVIDRKAERDRMERELRAEMEREQAAKAKAASQTAAAADGGRYMMQCAALRSQDSAESLKARIAFTAGLSSSLQVVNGGGGTVYKVMVGPFNGKAAADGANRKLQGAGISGCIPKKG